MFDFNSFFFFLGGKKDPVEKFKGTMGKGMTIYLSYIFKILVKAVLLFILAILGLAPLHGARRNSNLCHLSYKIIAINTIAEGTPQLGYIKTVTFDPLHQKTL